VRGCGRDRRIFHCENSDWLLLWYLVRFTPLHIIILCCWYIRDRKIRCVMMYAINGVHTFRNDDYERRTYENTCTCCGDKTQLQCRKRARCVERERYISEKERAYNRQNITREVRDMRQRQRECAIYNVRVCVSEYVKERVRTDEHGSTHKE